MKKRIKPVIGITVGDINGIGIELILKTLEEPAVYDYCQPVVLGHTQVLEYYKQCSPSLRVSIKEIADLEQMIHKQISVLSCWQESVSVTPGGCNATGGKYAVKSLLYGARLLQEKKIDALLTAPIHKENVLVEGFTHKGHTPFLQEYFGVSDCLMLMCAQNMRVGLLSEHIPVKEVASRVTEERIIGKIKLLEQALRQDFLIQKPKIAVLGLNPHCGDKGVIGDEEKQVIFPAVERLQADNILAFGPYSADAFFARAHFKAFDGVLAMYHDQGLIPFKSLALGGGVNYTAGLGAVRVAPDHGVAFDIAGKDKGSEESLRSALFTAIDICRARGDYAEMHANPLVRRSRHFFKKEGNRDE